MPDREKVIKGLECCMVGDGHSPKCELCPYATVGDDTCQTMDALFADALALIKGDADAIHGVPTGARVLTLDELRALPDEPQVPLVMEERVPIGTWDGGSVVKWCGSLFIQEEYVDDGTPYTNAKTYGKIWRVWTAWPDKATREATPWTT